MRIYCDTYEIWVKTICALVREGVTFDAYHNPRHPEWTIELTGGY
jgi:hypothetical protein